MGTVKIKDSQQFIKLARVLIQLDIIEFTIHRVQHNFLNAVIPHIPDTWIQTTIIDTGLNYLEFKARKDKYE